MKNLYLTSALVFATLVLWVSGLSLSEYLSKEPERRLKKEGHDHAQGESLAGKSPSNKSLDLSKLEIDYEKNPDSQEAAILYANALFESGMIEGAADNLKRAVGIYHEILERDPKQSDALLGLGTLSLHVGVSDKALEYYLRYIEVRPDDISIASNLALAEARSGKKDAALERLDGILTKNPDFVIAMVTKGLILSESGDKDAARALWLKAEELEENEVLKQRISSLIVSSLKSNTQGGIEIKKSNTEIKDFFRNHPIVGAKVWDIFDEEGSVLKVLLKDFPVNDMPEFAKTKFENSILSELNKSSYLTVLLIDANSREKLMEVKRRE